MGSTDNISGTYPGVERSPARPWAVHKKVTVLGTWLLASCVAIAAMGIWGMMEIERDQVQLTHRQVPALALLLRTDIDLYEAQLGLERAGDATDPGPRKAQLNVFTQNIGESDEKFSAYKALARESEEFVAISAYEADRLQWRHAAEQLANSLAHGTAGEDASPAGRNAGATPVAAASNIEAVRALFEPMRGHLNQIVVGIYEPAIENSANQIDRTTSLTRWKLFGGAMLALVVAGTVLTRTMVRTLRDQQKAAESINNERNEQVQRQIFEGRLSRALEMALDEPAALRLAEQAISIAAPEVTSEILLADSSRAHLHKTGGTGSPSGGCRVAKPSDCPAVRRGHRLNFESGAMFDACPYLKDRPAGNCSAVCIPLSIMGQTVGVLHAMGADGTLPPENHVLSLEQVASKTGERIGLLAAFQRSQAQALKDPLTGLLNRRSLEEKVHELTRQHVPFSVAYGDLDFFKNLNDTHGHETGDKALRTFAQVLKGSIRPGDLAARWGGEEFVLILPHATADEAVAVLERVRKALADVLRDADTPVFTVSFGVARTAEGVLFDDVLAGADESLLRAKKEGRNRTVRSPDLVPLQRVASDDELSASAA